MLSNFLLNEKVVFFFLSFTQLVCNVELIKPIRLQNFQLDKNITAIRIRALFYKTISFKLTLMYHYIQID